MSLLAITYPAIDPVAFHLGPLSVRWYGLAYMAGLLLGWWYVKHLLADTRLWRDGKPPFGQLVADDLLLWVTLAVVVGGRLGQVLLYDPGYYLANPAEIFKVWKGGMAFHGALFLSVVAMAAFARFYEVSLLSVWDLAAAAVPFGLFFGRIANFINAEHYGRPGDVPWAMTFCNDVVRSLSGGVCPAGMAPRHPSQLYEAALEGLVMLALLRVLTHHRLALRRPGLVGGAFLAWYAVARIIVENFREPESTHALNLGPLTAGQLYSLPMLAFGLWLVWQARRKASA